MRRVAIFDEESHAFSIGEHAELAATVGTVPATDSQEDSLTYGVTAGNGEGKFAIGGATGAIAVAAALDFETTGSYSLTFQASDGTNSAASSADVTVTDVNDAPVFGQDTYTFSIGETAKPWFFLGKVSATDPDEEHSILDHIGLRLTKPLPCVNKVLISRPKGALC